MLLRPQARRPALIPPCFLFRSPRHYATVVDGAIVGARRKKGDRVETRARRSLVPPLSLGGVAIACTLLVIFSVAAKPVTDPDFWWHLATGKYMVTHHVIPHYDVFSLTARSHRWITHEWLTELLFYGGWLLGGATLLSLLTGAVISLAFWVTYLAARERGAPAVVSAPIIVIAAFACAHTWGARPQMISMLLTALFGLAISRMLVRRQLAPPPWLPIVMIFWVNLHGGFIFGIALLGIAVGGYLIQDWVRMSRRTDEELPPMMPRINAVRSIVVVVLTALATLLNPNGLAGALYPLSYLGNNASTRYIAEWVSPDFHKPQYLFFEALVLILLVGAMANPRRARLVDVLILLPFLYLSFDSVRNINLLSVLAAPIAAELVTGALPIRRRAPRTARTRDNRRFLINWVCVGIVAAAVVISAAVAVSGPGQAKAVKKDFPVGALRYIQLHGLPARGFDSYNWGGYLIWQWYGQRAVYVDGRPDMYGDAFMNSYVSAYDGNGSWSRLLDVNRLCYVLVEPSSGIAHALSTDHAWQRRYQDAEAVLYLRAGPARGCTR